MGRLGTFVLGALIGGALIFAAQRYHVLRTDKGVELVPKLSANFSDTYVDIRGYTAADWAQRKALTAALVQAGREDLIRHAVAGQFRARIDRFLDELGGLREP